jgi:hypothetical protein
MGQVCSTDRRDKKCTKYLVVKSEGKNHLEDQDVDGRIILGWILEKRVGGCGLDASGSGQGPAAGSCEHGSEHPGSI